MIKRVLAWTLLVGFLLLLINLLIFRWQPILSLGIYILIALSYVFFGMGKKN